LKPIFAIGGGSDTAPGPSAGRPARRRASGADGRRGRTEGAGPGPRFTQSRIEVLESKPVTEWREVRRGWCLGSEEFRDRMLGLLEGAMGGMTRTRPQRMWRGRWPRSG